MRTGSFVLVSTFLIAGCAPWESVPESTMSIYQGADPAAEMKAILTTASMTPPLSVEVTDRYVKVVHRELEAPYAYTQVLAFDQVADIHVIHRGSVYQVTASGAGHHEIFVFRPHDRDLATCRRFVDAFHALTQHAVPVPPPAG